MHEGQIECKVCTPPNQRLLKRLLFDKNWQLAFGTDFFDRQTLSMRLLNSLHVNTTNVRLKNSFLFHLPVSDSVDSLAIIPAGVIFLLRNKSLTELELINSHSIATNSR